VIVTIMVVNAVALMVIETARNSARRIGIEMVIATSVYET